MRRYDEALSRCELEASGHHGIITRSFAINQGLTDRVIQRLISSGRWIRVLPGTYLVAGAPLTWHARLTAAQSWAGTRSLLSHRSAGALLQLDGIEERFVELVSPNGLSAQGVKVHRLREGDEPRGIFVSGFKVTNVQRTLQDLYSVMPAKQAELALEDALRRRLTTLDRLWLVDRERGRPGRNGVKAFRRSLLLHDDRDGTLQSRMEAKLRRILRTLSGPSAVPQFPVEVEGDQFFIDFAYPDVLLGIEAQSLKWHMGRERWSYDLRRDRRLKTRGWTMLYYPWDDLHLNPKWVADEIQRMRNELALRLL
jgi:very-short-patch-repair endonuclease